MKIPKIEIKRLLNWLKNGRGINMHSLISYFQQVSSRAKLFSTNNNGSKSYFITIGGDTCEIKELVPEIKDMVRLYSESLHKGGV